MSPGAPPAFAPETLSRLLYGLEAAFLVFIPAAGIAVGGATVSLVLNALGRENRDAGLLRLSGELGGTAAHGAVLLASLLPLPFLAFLYQRALAAASPLPRLFWIAPIGLIGVGAVLLRLYGSAVRRPAEVAPWRRRAGTAGVLAAAAGVFALLAAADTLANPEKLPLIRMSALYLVSWNAVVKFLMFLGISFGLTGGVVLLLPGRPSKGAPEAEARYRAYVRTRGASLALAAALALPVLAVLGLVSLPVTARAAGTFVAYGAVLLLALLIVLLLLALPGARENGPGGRVSVLFVLIVLAFLAGDRSAVESAFRGRTPVAALPPAAPEAARPPAAGEEAALEMGRGVFEKVCSGCHRFDVRVVGPPLAEVVPKYRGDVEKLKAFIANPVKVDPAYPPMPDLGLKDEEIDAVARYLLAQVGRGG